MLKVLQIQLELQPVTCRIIFMGCCFQRFYNGQKVRPCTQTRSRTRGLEALLQIHPLKSELLQMSRVACASSGLHHHQHPHHARRDRMRTRTRRPKLI